MRKPFVFLTLLLIHSGILLAQKEWVNWNSANGGITFKNGIGTQFAGVPKNLQFPDYTGQRSFSYSDPVTGNLLFLTDGENIWNKAYRTVLYPPGDTLISCDSDYYNVQVVPFNDDPNKFYLFHLYSAKGVVSAMESGISKSCDDPALSALYYSVLEMNFSSGTGRLLSKNQPLLRMPLDRVMLVRHANKKDNWVIGRSWDSAHFSAFLVTDDKISPPVNTTIGPPAKVPASNIHGSVAVSPDGKTLAVSGSASYVEVYDFNNQTGELSNYRTITLNKEIVTSLCFSPDNSKLYIAATDAKACENYSQIYQANFDERDLEKSLFVVKKYVPRKLDLGLANDNHVWIKGTYYPGYPGIYYDLISYPNQPKNACIVKERHMQIAFQSFFPNIVNGTIQEPKEVSIAKMRLADTVEACLGVYNIDAAAGYEEYRWSTGENTPSINVKEPGLYRVLAGKKGFTKPDAYGFVYVKAKGGEVFLAQDTFYCPKEPSFLIVPPGFGNIRWGDGDTNRIKPVTSTGLYKLTAISNASGCTVWDSICVTLRDDPMVNFGVDTTLCDRTELVLKLKSYVDSSGTNIKKATFLWQDGSTKNTYLINKPGTYWGQTSFNGCTVRDTIDVKYIPMPVVNIGKDTALCAGGEVSLSVPYYSNVNYLWANGSTDTSIVVKSSGTYWIKAISEFCIETDTLSAIFKPIPNVSLGNDTTICEGTGLLLNNSGSVAGYDYTWNNGQKSVSLPVTSAGIYSLKVNLNGCYAFDTISINTLKAPEVKLMDTFVCNQSTLILDPGSSVFDNIKWQDGSSTRTYTVHTAGSYSVTLTNKCGRDFAQVTVRNKLCEIVMPLAFTPNGDNLNDYFRIKYPDIVRSMNLTIFNRYGQKIFESADVYKGWDGRYKGVLQTSGTYVWKLSYTDVQNFSHIINGYVVLIR